MDAAGSRGSATTREAIRTAACEQLGAREAYSSVWIGELGDTLDHVVPVTTDGSMGALADEIQNMPASSPLQSMVMAALEANKVRTVDGILDDPGWDPVRETAMKYGFRSVAAVPIPLTDEPDEVLVVHAAESNAFTDDELDVFGELGQTIGGAMTAVGTTRSQLARSPTELKFRIADERLLFNRLSNHLDANVTLQGVVPMGDGSLVGFFSTDADPESVTDLADAVHVLESIDLLAEEDSTGFYRLTGEVTAFFEVLDDHEARLQAVEATDGTTSITLRVPDTVSVREFVDDLSKVLPQSELLARRSRVTDPDTPMTFHESIREACTDRQYQALRVAFYGGYYEWPRTATNEDLSDVLDISSPTYQSHRRAAERVVMSTLFEGTA